MRMRRDGPRSWRWYFTALWTGQFEDDLHAPRGEFEETAGRKRSQLQAASSSVDAGSDEDAATDAGQSGSTATDGSWTPHQRRQRSCGAGSGPRRSEEHTSELQSLRHLV